MCTLRIAWPSDSPHKLISKGSQDFKVPTKMSQVKQVYYFWHVQRWGPQLEWHISVRCTQTYRLKSVPNRKCKDTYLDQVQRLDRDTNLPLYPGYDTKTPRTQANKQIFLIFKISLNMLMNYIQTYTSGETLIHVTHTNSLSKASKTKVVKWLGKQVR